MMIPLRTVSNQYSVHHFLANGWLPKPERKAHKKYQMQSLQNMIVTNQLNDQLNFGKILIPHRGKAQSYIPDLLKKVKHDHLGISVLLDAAYNDEVLQPSSYSVEALKDTVQAIKDSLQVSCNEVRKNRSSYKRTTLKFFLI